ncbi:hypothetical protein HanPSC8_Chr17g0784011 [Helianthus annuus]|nr:hypothetical protein HanPSC8_Chr17g0784011 [Helianthus annuus]
MSEMAWLFIFVAKLQDHDTCLCNLQARIMALQLSQAGTKFCTSHLDVSAIGWGVTQSPGEVLTCSSHQEIASLAPEL